jgi:two-component system sensor histidine kinase BarA
MRTLLSKITPYWALCLCFFSFIAFVCIIAYLLVSDLAIDHVTLAVELHLLAYQLTLLTLSSSIVFSAGLRIYFYLREQKKSLGDPQIAVMRTSIAAVTETETPHPLASSKNVSTSNTTVDQVTDAKQKRTTLHLLIVDDNYANIMIIESYLQASDRIIFTANNGLDAIKLFERESIDIIFMDLEMCDMSGAQTLQHIRTLEKKSSVAKQQRTPAIAVSAHSREAMQYPVLQQGFDDYLAKPVNRKDALDTLQRWQPVALGNTDTNEEKSLSTTTHHDNDVARSISPPLNTTTSHHEDNLQKVVNIKDSLVHSNNNHQLAKDMLQLLITMINTEKDHLHLLYEAKDWEILYQLNHKIYGGSSYCGVPQLQSANKKLEILLQQHLSLNTEKDSLATEPATDDIRLAVTEVHAAIDEIIEWNEQHDTDVIFNLV